MYLIAICDDEMTELYKTEQMLNDYAQKDSSLDFVIDCFNDADELLRMVREKKYMPDLVLLDIYMPGKLGIEVAKELRGMGSTGKIIFLTASREHALDAFSVDAAQYLVKPISAGVLFRVLDRFLENAREERRKYLLLRIDGKIRRIAVNDILYCEAQRKKQYLYLTGGIQHQLRITITELYGMLSDYKEFTRVGVAYIVNLGHVESLNARELQMESGKKIYLPRGAYQSLREIYFDYYCEGEQ